MRNTNCENIRREIEEAGSADLLGVAAISHIQGCPACETLSQQQSRLQELVASLGTVEAPGDFDFRLRARLAAEKRGGASSLLSFGLRPAALAAALLLIGSAIVFLSLRTQPVAPVAKQETPKVAPESQPNANRPSSTVSPDQMAVLQANSSSSGSEGVRPIDRAAKNRSVRNELTAQSKRPATLDSGSTPAVYVRPDNRLAESYPTAAFPINASYQSLKVSVDDGRGASRTISLPTVSFGSERTISQNPSPAIASARGAW